MKAKNCQLLLALTLLGIAADAVADETLPNSISIRASASVSAKPDTLYITLFAAGDGMLTEDASKAVASKSEEIKNAIGKAFPKIQIVITPLKMGEKLSRIYREDAAQAPRPEVLNRITIAADPSIKPDVPKIIDVALRAGAILQTSSGASYVDDLGSVIRYGVANYARAEEEARSKAWNEAREKATALAKLSGKTIGELVSISDESGTYPYQEYTRSSRGKVPTKYVSFSDEPIEVSVSFRVTFELKK